MFLLLTGHAIPGSLKFCRFTVKFARLPIHVKTVLWLKVHKTQAFDCLNYSLRRATDEHLNNIKYGLLIIIKYNRIKM